MYMRTGDRQRTGETYHFEITIAFAALALVGESYIIFSKAACTSNHPPCMYVMSGNKILL